MKKILITLSAIIFLLLSCDSLQNIKKYSYLEKEIKNDNACKYTIDQLFIKIERTNIFGLLNNKLIINIYGSIRFITPYYAVESFQLLKKPNRKLSNSEKELILKSGQYNDSILKEIEIESYEFIPKFSKIKNETHEYIYSEPSYFHIEYEIEKMVPWGIDIFEIKIENKKQIVYRGMEK